MLTMTAALLLLQAGAAPATCVPAPAKFTAPTSMPWYTSAAPVTVKGRRYVKYGLTRTLMPRDLDPAPLAQVDGGLFYAERGNPDHEVLYLLTNLAGCEVQPYQVKPDK